MKHSDRDKGRILFLYTVALGCFAFAVGMGLFTQEISKFFGLDHVGPDGNLYAKDSAITWGTLGVAIIFTTMTNDIKYRINFVRFVIGTLLLLNWIIVAWAYFSPVYTNTPLGNILNIFLLGYYTIGVIYYGFIDN